MIKLKFFLFFLMLSLTIACSENRRIERVQSLPDTQENRMIAAKRYAAVMPIEEVVRDSVQIMAQSIPEKDREKFVELMSNDFEIKELERGTFDSMVKHFTVRELDALTKFYGSPEGQSVKKKFGGYMADIMPLIEQEMLKALKHMQEEKK